MDCGEFRERLAHILDEKWVPEGKAIVFSEDLREHARQCPKCTGLLEAVQLMVEDSGTVMRAPPGLADRITREVLKSDTADRRWDRIRHGVVGLAAAAILVIATVFTTIHVMERNGMQDTSQGTVIVRLEFQASEAQSVAVVGDWNGWDSSTHQMIDRDGDGIWEIEIEVLRNQEYRYQFLVDGEKWVPDPRAPITVSDGFGGTNSVLNI